MLPALIVSGLMLGALWLFLSVYIRQVENFAGAMNFVMFPMFFFSSALYPLWKLREGGSEVLYWVSLANPFTHAVELIRFALYGDVRAGRRAGRRRRGGAVLPAGGATATIRSAACCAAPRQPAVSVSVRLVICRAISLRMPASSSAVCVSRGRATGTSAR